jgi:hypothetical protein
MIKILLRISLPFYWLNCLTCIASNAQSHHEIVLNELGFQWGFSLKADVEFPIQGHQPPVFRFCGDFGVASEFLAKALYPSINEEVQIYNGGFGSMRRPAYKKPFVTVDFITAFTLTTGFNNYFTSEHLADTVNWHVMPLYYFADFVKPALENPYNFSLSLGTDVIASTDKHKTSQRIGFLNAHLGSLQFSYYNDGGSPFDQLSLGDSKDRYYTGGAVVSYSGLQKDLINYVELSFHKFTGYTRNAFEVSNKLDLAYVNYNDENQKYYNKSMWSLNVSNPIKGYGINLKRYNYTKWDIQDLIHWSTFNSYHLVPYDDYFSLAGGYYFGYTNIGIR